MKKSWRLLVPVLAVVATLGCATEPDGTGSNTNWLHPCDSDAACGGTLTCLCSHCVAACDAACDDAGGVCARAGDAAHDALCAGPISQLPVATPALCLPTCSDDVPCGEGQLCLEGACLPAGPADTDCPDGLSLIFDEGPLQAREGMAFSASYYLPVDYDAEPTDWVEPGPWPRLGLSVTLDGAPVPDCEVRAWTGGDNGWAYLDAASSDASGRASAVWVAGAAAEQRLTMAVTTMSGRVVTAQRLGNALPHDAPPLAADEGARASTVSPVTTHLAWDLAESTGSESTEYQSTVRPRTFPHHAFYGALSCDGMFAGLQNRSDSSDLADTSVADRVLIFSVWNTSTTLAEVIHAADDVVCVTHDQDEGGFRCNLEDAWSELDRDHVFSLAVTRLALDEVGPDYAALGYSTSPCPSATGCKDYALTYAAPDAEPRVVAVLRRPDGAGVTVSSFIQPYGSLPTETSCLATPRYDALFELRGRIDGALQPAANATPSSSLAAWDNRVCLNYGAGVLDGRVWLATGGPDGLGAPQDFDGRSLTVAQ
ncbi:MAG TPA: hypothetical protein VLC09_07090 [Polyangiaceae bacterium]|nr:hypothetical protein [Polyangiaceae bacterium]